MFLINFICANLPFKKDEKMDLLSINSLRERTYHLLEILNREVTAGRNQRQSNRMPLPSKDIDPATA